MSARGRHLCFILRLPPEPGHGSGIIALRHLRRLHAEGWRITVACDEAVSWTPPEGWRVIALPRRKPGWPPCRENVALSVRLRGRLLARELARALPEPADVVLTVLWGDVFTEAARVVSRLWWAPLAILAHDRPELMMETPGERARRVWGSIARRAIHDASVVWPVTRGLLDAYRPPRLLRIRELPPIPDPANREPAAWREQHRLRPVVIHAGRIHAHQRDNFDLVASTLAAAGGEFRLVAPADDPVWRDLSARHPSVVRVDPFPANEAVKDYLREHASALLVSYHHDATMQPWAATSFPSKLIDYAPLGVPVAILAPSHAAVSAWAERHDYPLLASVPSPEALAALWSGVRDRDTWESAARILAASSRREFCPERIHRRFSTDLATLAPRPRPSLGRLWLLGVHQPLQRLRETFSRAPWDEMLCARGRREMRRAAATLAPAPVAPHAGQIPAVFLTGHGFWEQTALCAHSLRAQLGSEIPITILDDGSLREGEAAHLRRILPGARIHWSEDIEGRLDEALPETRFPVLRRHRLLYPHLRKLTDVHATLGPGWKLVLDSDMLFFRRPDALAAWLRDPDGPCYATDVAESYGYPRAVMEELAGSPLPERLNVGVLGLRSESVDWDALERWTADLLARHGAHYFLEQGLSAMLVARLPAGLRLSREDYLVMPDRAEGRSPRAVLHHYVAGSKSAYFQDAWRVALARVNARQQP